MPPILAILFILLGTFLNGIFANQPGIVLFKIVANNKSTLKIEHVRILQNGHGCCEQAILLPTNLNESKQFMVDWRQFPAEEMKVASDLKKIKFQLQFGVGDNIPMVTIGLETRSDHLLKQLFDGGQANILIGREYKHNDINIKYVEAKQSDPGHLMFTVDSSQLSLPNVQFKSVQILQTYTNFMKTVVKEPCESVQFGKGDPVKFLVDWKNCRGKKIKEPEMLRNIKLLFEFTCDGNQIPRIPIKLEKYSAGAMKQFFAGGEAKIVIDDKDTKVTYEKDPIGNDAPRPGILTLEIRAEHTLHSARLEIIHSNKEHKLNQENFHEYMTTSAHKLAQCQPETIYEYGKKYDGTIDYMDCTIKHRINWADCGVSAPEDLQNLDFWIFYNYFQNLRKFVHSQRINCTSLFKHQTTDVLNGFFVGGEAEIGFSDPTAAPTFTFLHANYNLNECYALPEGRIYHPTK